MKTNQIKQKVTETSKNDLVAQKIYLNREFIYALYLKKPNESGTDREQNHCMEY